MSDYQFLIIPKWFYAKNIGDSIITTCLPKVIKHKHPGCYLKVVTAGEMLNIFSSIPEVDDVSLPSKEILAVPHTHWSSSGIKYSVFPEEKPEYFEFWNSRYDYFTGHPTLNRLAVNYLLQNELEYAVDLDIDFSPKVLPKILSVEKELHEQTVIAIVPEKKTANRAEAHPSCDGIGYRFNGDQGESWTALVAAIREEYPDIVILEVTEDELKFGDVKTNATCIRELAYYATLVDVAITADGGMHHVFNSQQTPVLLLDSWPIAKPDLYKLGNGIPVVDPDCQDRCYAKLRNITDWGDTSRFCNKSCCNLRTKTIIDSLKNSKVI